MDNNGKLSMLKDALWLAIGEAVVSLITALVFLAIGQFGFDVVAGLLLGSGVMVLNFLILSISINRAIDNYMQIRGEKEMDDEEAVAFAAKYSSSVQSAATGSYLLRTVLMLAALVGAFLLKGVFNVIATLVPLVMYRPIIYVMEVFRKRSEK